MFSSYRKNGGTTLRRDISDPVSEQIKYTNLWIDHTSEATRDVTNMSVRIRRIIANYRIFVFGEYRKNIRQKHLPKTERTCKYFGVKYKHFPTVKKCKCL